MKYNIALTGIAAEEAGKNELVIELMGPVKLSELESELQKKIPALGRYLIKFSVNGHFHHEDVSVSEGDELLVFTPYAGG
ncbi:MAG TPA: MoaD/ThiS family protein [Bacteroidales bacterium]|nr:MoaD/ThiS family protein [Bacteroidales bacterium]